MSLIDLAKEYFSLKTRKGVISDELTRKEIELAETLDELKLEQVELPDGTIVKIDREWQQKTYTSYSSRLKVIRSK